MRRCWQLVTGGRRALTADYGSWILGHHGVQVRHGSHSIPWHPHSAAAADDDGTGRSSAAASSDGDDSCPAARDVEKGVTSEVRPMSALPGPAGWPVVGNFLTYIKKQNRGRMHLVQMELHRQYGKMFRENWGGKWQLHVADADVIEQVYRREGRYPHRPGLSPWNLYMETSGRIPGLFIAQGEQWQRQRQILSREMLSRDIVAKLSAPIISVTDDFITRLREVRDVSGDQAVVNQLPNFVYRWTLEASASFLFETRLGSLQSVVPARTCQFIDALQQMMVSSLHLIVGDRVHRALNTPYWRRHKDAWDRLFHIATELVDERLASLEHGDSKLSGLFLTCLLRDKDVQLQEVYSSTLDLLIAGTDTTANAYCFLVNLLANNPEVQQRVYDEMTEVLRDNELTAATEKSLFKYLTCVIKETLRLFPSATMNVRILDEDAVIAGYEIPKQTMIVMNHYAASRDPEVFEDPDKFIPERWMRSGGRIESQKHPFASLPFGSGSRSCLGRRIAMSELTAIVVKTLSNFRVEAYPGVEFEPTLRTLLTPGDRVPVRFVDRQQAVATASPDHPSSTAATCN